MLVNCNPSIATPVEDDCLTFHQDRGLGHLRESLHRPSLQVQPKLLIGRSRAFPLKCPGYEPRFADVNR